MKKIVFINIVIFAFSLSILYGQNGGSRIFVAKEMYRGLVVNGVREGDGQVENEYGIFEGTFKYGKANGRGKIRYSTGAYYEGEFKNDYAFGKGIFITFEGDKYEGDFIDGVRQGKGKYIFNVEWINGKMVKKE